MPSTYTVNLGIEKPATGEQSGTWGDTTNINFDILDQAINGCLSLTLASAGTSGSPNTLAISDGATSDGRNKWIEFVDGGDLGATAYVQLTPNDAEKIVFIRNSLSGSRSVILFQGTYDAGRDLEVPAGVDMVVKFSGGGATATTTDIFTKLRATEITTPTLTTDDLTAGTADINDGTVEAVIGGTTPKAGTFTNLTANTNLSLATGATVTGINTTTNMSDASATTLATSLSIKTYVDDQVATVDTLAEVLANGNTSGANNLIIDSGQAITTNTVNETTAGTGVTIDSVLLKDNGVNATNLEITNIKANDGTAAGSIADSTGAFTINSFVSNSVDIGGGAIDDTTIGGTTPASGNFTTLTSDGLTVDGTGLFTSASAGDVLEIKSTDTGAGSGPNMVFYRQATGAASDALAKLRFYGQDSSSNITEYASFDTSIIDASNGTEDGKLTFNVISGGSSREYLSMVGSSYTAFNDGGLDIDFRVESDSNANALFVDAGDSQVGINTSVINAAFAVQKANSSNPTLRLIGDNTASVNAEIRFQALNSASTNRYADIVFNPDISTGAIQFYTDYSYSTADKALQLDATNGAIFNDGGSSTRDFRVESVTHSHMLFVDSGNDRVGINRSVPDFTLDLYNPSGSSTTFTGAFRAGGDSDDNRSSVFIGQQSNSRGLVIRGGRAAGDRAIAQQFLNLSGGVVGSNMIMMQTFYQDGSDYYYTINEDSANVNFRVESDSNNYMLYVDAGENVASLGMTNASIPAWMGNNSVVVADNVYGFQGASYANACYNISVDNPYTYFLHNGYYATGGWTQRLAGYGNSMYRLGQAKHQWEVAADVGTDDTNITWRPIMAASETDGFVWNENSYDTDFRVESNNNTHALFVDAGNDVVCINTASFQPLGVSYFKGSLVTTHSGSQNGVYAVCTDSTTSYGYVAANNGTSGQRLMSFHDYDGSSNPTVGSITQNGTTTFYNTSSDYRLKEDVQPMVGSVDLLMALRPVNFAWKKDGTRVDGFLAHEVQEVVPQAVIGEKDGKEMQVMDQSKLVPLLTATLQEALQKIETLEARIAALENS